MLHPKYVAPSSWEEAAQLLNDHKGSKLLAGGTDLLVSVKKGDMNPSYLIDLKHLANLNDNIIIHNDDIQIEALTLVEEIASSKLIRERAPVLSQAAGRLGSWQIRNMATIGGNICNASPAADMVPALLILEAVAEIKGQKETRHVPLCDFFTGPGSTMLSKTDILRRVIIPAQPSGARSQYLKFSIKKSMDLPLVGVAALLQIEDGVCREARVSLGAVAPVPMRARETEAVLKDKELTTELLADAANTAAGECFPLSDIRASAEYRREIVKVYTRRALGLAANIEAANFE